VAGFLLSTTQVQAFSETLERLYSAATLERFPGVLMDAVSRVIGCVHMTFDELNLTDGSVRNQFDREISMSRTEFLSRWTHFKDEHPGIAHVAAGGSRCVMTIDDFITQRQFRQTGLYNEVFQPLGARAQLAAIIPVTGQVVGIAINRESEFSAREKQLLELLQPHIVRAHFNAQVFTSLQTRSAAPPDFLAWRRSGLTRRECEILRWVSEGKRDAEISVILGVSCRTVNHHVASILRKLGVETRTNAAARALESFR